MIGCQFRSRTHIGESCATKIPSRPARSLVTRGRSHASDLQIKQQFTFGVSLDLGNLGDIIVDGRPGCLRFLINSKLDSGCGYSCGHGINRYDNLPCRKLSVARLRFVKKWG